MDINTSIEESTQDKILYAAMAIISEGGLKALSASKLASAVNISKSTVFHYFKKMDDIPAMVLERLYSEILQPLQEAEYDSCPAYLRAIGTASFSVNEEQLIIYKAFVSLFQASIYHQQLREIVNGCSLHFSSRLFEGLRKFSKPGVEDSDLKILSQLIIKTLDGVCLHFLINHDRQQAQASWEAFVDAITKQYQLS